MSERTQVLAGDLGQLLQQREWYITTAESCTGGGIASALTDIAGCSAWFASSVVTYSNKAKHRFLQVPREVLREHGAVSEMVVRVMAQGALEQHGAELAIAVSGIAGPGGGSEQRPVGTVWFAWMLGGELEHCETDCQVFSGDRLQVREATICHALERSIALLNT